MNADAGNAQIYEDGCLRVEHENYFVSCKGTFVPFTKTEFLLVSRLSRNLNRVVHAQELWDYAWGMDKPFNPQCLHVFLYRVRRKLMPYGLRIENMVNIGYGLQHGTCCNGESKRQQSFGSV
jgi:DNA-binding response OmpR family regulator